MVSYFSTFLAVRSIILLGLSGLEIETDETLLVRLTFFKSLVKASSTDF